MAILRYLDESGAPCIREWPADADWPEGAVEVDRLPGAFEDFVGGVWTYDAKGHADSIAGPAHIAEARILKYAEAKTIGSGAATPMLAAEAADKGITIAELAAMVNQKRAEFIAAEVARQRGQATPADTKG